MEAGEWVTIVVTSDRQGRRAWYVDGILQFQVADSTERYAVVDEENQVWFFRDNANREENAGAVDRIRLWDVPLTAAQVAPSRPEGERRQ